MKTLNSTDFMTSVKSVKASLTRMSGLSEPYRPIASAKSITGNGFGRSMSSVFLKTTRIMSSNRSRISCSVRNEVSQSICVNSGWRSARRSSSRKHLVIW
ncbi:hypothetical protein D3C85_1360920 [compost metagenome]